MMQITQDYMLIRSILERPDILPGFTEGQPLTKEAIEDPNMVYFHDENVGLFIAHVFPDKKLMFHVAIPKENRGRKAIKAAKRLARKLLANGYQIFARQKNIPHLKRFVQLIGFELFKHEDGYNYFQLKGV